ncbi:drug resistance transporter, EmrB/QacA subfamily [Desulfovibrio sp. X2]|uniref:DHA2 family efflux MFS transporter permease subunit n=1 Tax=Desulfovibrio sp. X2 TaxID=941449 RepID=UPI000358A36E|nr:DHA2 family efflux MFS transporter permease subunit [Desulfovibrio sp. X2]EPR44587.1 drug resistance transporter, EmrB/QacA subfamily [Desulfovibrio sp. X2]
MASAAQREVNKYVVTVSVMIPTLIEILDTSIANVSLAHIQGSLSAGQDEVTWVLTSYLVSNAIVIPISGWLARLMGRKTYLLASVALFTLASMLCGMATSLGQLIFFRVVQGIGGGGLQPMSQAILLEAYPAEERGMAMSVFAMGAVLGPILGPLIGGWITDSYSWRWIFYINVPFGVLALFLISSFISDPEYMKRREKGEGVDYVGLALLAVGLGALQIVLDKGQRDDWFSSDFILTLAVTAGVCLLAFLVWELTRKQPIVDLREFRDRSFALGNLLMFFGFFAFFGAIVLLPLYLQNLMGYTAYLAGLVLGPGGLIMLLVLPIVGRLTQKMDARILLCMGMLVNAYSLSYMAGFTLQIDFGTAILARNIQAVGIALFFPPLALLTMAYVPRERMNNASAIFNLLRNLGGSFGTAFVTTMLARRAQFHQARIVERLNPSQTGYAEALDHLRRFLDTSLLPPGDTATRAMGEIYNQALRQASAMAYLDVFQLQSWIFLVLAGLLWIMRRPRPGAGQDGPPVH